MKSIRFLAAVLVLCQAITALVACDSSASDESGKAVEFVETECSHKFSQGYCKYCEEMDPSCIELTSENYSDYLSIKYRIANVDGSNGPYGFVAFPRIFLTASSKSSRITFYNVSIKMEITVQQALYQSGGKYEEYTTSVTIPISILGDGEAEGYLGRESSDPVSLDKTYISDFKIISVAGCISLD